MATVVVEMRASGGRDGDFGGQHGNRGGQNDDRDVEVVTRVAFVVVLSGDGAIVWLR